MQHVMRGGKTCSASNIVNNTCGPCLASKLVSSPYKKHNIIQVSMQQIIN